MKLALVLLAIFGTAFAAPSPSIGGTPRSDLRPALDAILAHVKVDEILALYPQLEATAEGQFILDYLRGPKWGTILDVLYAEKAFNDLLAHLANNGLEGIYQAIEDLREFLGIPPRSVIRAEGDFQDLVDKVVACIDTDGLLQTVLELVSSDEATQGLLAFLSEEDCRQAYLRIKAHEYVQDLANFARENGVDVDTLVALVEAILGWSPDHKAVKAENLRPALDQLLENIDTETILSLLPELEQTPEGQFVLEYLRGPKWATIIDVLYAEQAWNDLLDFLANNGLPGIYDAIEALRELLGIPPKPFIRKAGARDFQDLVDKIVACINLDGLLEDVLELLGSDPAVQALLGFLSSAECRAAYLRIKAHEYVKDLAQFARDQGIDIDTIIALVESILGWAETRAIHADNLRPAFDQLLENVNLVAIITLLPELEATPEGQHVLEYLRGERWGAVLDALYAEEAFTGLLAHIAANGIPEIYEAIEALRELLGIPARPTIRKAGPRASFEDLIDQIIALIDVNGLLEDLLELLGSDVAVQNLLAYLSDPDCREAYQRIKNHPEVQHLIEYAREHEIDIDTLLALIESILGWSRRFVH